MGDKKKILAIDDNVMLLKIFTETLSPKYEVSVVKSAAEALSFLNTNAMDIILLDIEMPNITGFEFLKDIRKIPSYMSVPVIIVSGNTGMEFFEEAKQSSAFDVLSKPVSQKKLETTIERALAASS